MSLPFIVKTRPVCANCGKKCGQRHHDWPIGRPEAAPWDGTSWRFPYNPFCTLRCALAYARWAYEGHHGRRKLA